MMIMSAYLVELVEALIHHRNEVILVYLLNCACSQEFAFAFMHKRSHCAIFDLIKLTTYEIVKKIDPKIDRLQSLSVLNRARGTVRAQFQPFHSL